MKLLLLTSACLAALGGAMPVAARQPGHDHMNMEGQPASAPQQAEKPAQPGGAGDMGDMPDMAGGQGRAAPKAGSGEGMADRPGMGSSSQPAAEPMQHQGMEGMSHGGGDSAMTGALGAYPMTREASGTSWQPDSGIHQGIHLMSGNWMLMGHALLNGVYSSQGGPRGDDKAFVSGMLMGSARRDFANGGILQFRGMLSPDPLMGARGYPLLLASGETANGVDPLVDRQHPHDLFMELSASYSHPLSATASIFLYAGLPGEPAFGPPAFMHRMSIMDSPEAPISHHWLDSTHIVFGVVTGGLVLDRFKIEASRFNGREPDQHRFDIETGPLSSTAVRLSWNPDDHLSLQASWGRFKHSEQLEPEVNQTRWSASGIYTRPLGAGRWWSTTLAWGRRSAEGQNLDAYVLESAVGLRAWTIFGRAERTENNELLTAFGHHGPAFDVGKISIGTVRDFPVATHLKFGIGALYARNFVPEGLKPSYGGDQGGGMAFVRLKIE